MRINEVIRKFRKEQNLTQEQVANYLGVTAPAVNKWENGNSYPDITLLAPLARLLNTNVDTLLSFKEELTDIEIDQFVKDISGEMNKEGYEKVFDKANDKIKEYPNCDKLILNVAQLMNAYLIMGSYDINDSEKYQKQIKAWFEAVSLSDDKELANVAFMSLSQDYLKNGEYEKAQKLLDQIPPIGFDKRSFQATLFSKQGQYDKSYEIHESLIFQHANSVIASLMYIEYLLCEQLEYKEAIEYSDLISSIANQFDLGKYIGLSTKLTIYLKMQEVEKSIDVLEEMMTVGIDTMQVASKSKLYPHMKFKEEASIKDMERMIIKSLEEDTEINFLRENKRFKNLLDKIS